MPELPEVETVARDLQRRVAGAVISDAEVRWERTVRHPQPADRFVAELRGATIRRVGRRAKSVLLHLDDGRVMTVALRITRADKTMFDDCVAVARMKRTPEELVDWLFRAQEFPEGVVLLTGTGLVPAGDFTLLPRDEVIISITGLGELRNTVERVGRADMRSKPRVMS